MNDKIREKLNTLPETPGSYQMLDKTGKIIYVGKAKNLKNRVRSYFIGAHNEKTTALVSKIDDLTYIETSNETEAFLLEINLIKEHNPFYNIDLTDDKTYPYIEFTREANPKFIITRKLSKKNNRYFGPYPNVYSARKTLELINKLYKMRKCKTLPKKPCFYYEIGECAAPCINKISKERYEEIYQEVKSFLNGTDKTLVNEIKSEMAKYSENLDFENAKKCRDSLNAINDVMVKQDVLFKDKINADVYGITSDEDMVSITTIILRNGKIVLSKSDVFFYYFDLNDAVIGYILNQYKSIDPPENIYIEKDYEKILSSLIPNTILFTPIKGAKHNLLLMAKENSLTQLKNKTKIQIDKRRVALEELSKLLNIEVPHRIESFDNSNLFGDSPVSSMVVYIDGKKNSKEYRKYRVKTIVGPDDYGTMREVTYRRYKRVLDEGLERPDLILIDGGKGQIDACLNSLSKLNLDIKVAGLKKDDKHDTSTIIYKNIEYNLDKHSEVYRLCFEIQEEVHRFAITFYRTTKEKNAFQSVLDGIKGIGDITKSKLLSTYKTIDEISKAKDEELLDLGLNKETILALKERLKDEFDE